MKKRKLVLLYTIPFPIILILGVAPLLVTFAGGYIASLYGVGLNEGSPPNIPS
jgi:hypothetical protein